MKDEDKHEYMRKRIDELPKPYVKFKTKLKTLEDLEVEEDDCYGKPETYPIEENHEPALIAITKSAIEDIKAIQNMEKTILDKEWKKITGLKIEYSEEGKQAIINYIKWKNNITEEDLQLNKTGGKK